MENTSTVKQSGEIERLYGAIVAQQEAISNLYYRLESVSSRQQVALGAQTVDSPMMNHISDAVDKINFNTDAINSMASELVI